MEEEGEDVAVERAEVKNLAENLTLRTATLSSPRGSASLRRLADGTSATTLLLTSFWTTSRWGTNTGQGHGGEQLMVTGSIGRCGDGDAEQLADEIVSYWHAGTFVVQNGHGALIIASDTVVKVE